MATYSHLWIESKINNDKYYIGRIDIDSNSIYYRPSENEVISSGYLKSNSLELLENIDSSKSNTDHISMHLGQESHITNKKSKNGEKYEHIIKLTDLDHFGYGNLIFDLIGNYKTLPTNPILHKFTEKDIIHEIIFEIDEDLGNSITISIDVLNKQSVPIEEQQITVNSENIFGKLITFQEVLHTNEEMVVFVSLYKASKEISPSERKLVKLGFYFTKK